MNKNGGDKGAKVEKEKTGKILRHTTFPKTTDTLE